MKYSQGMDMNYLLEKQKRYKKLIKSYQINDISREYNQIKKVNEKLTEKMKQQTLDIEELKNNLTNRELELQEVQVENDQLKRLIANNKSSTTNNIIQQLQDTVTKELQRHLFLIYHLSDVLMTLDQNAASKEVFDITDNFETDETEESQNPATITEEIKEISHGQFFSALQRSDNEVKPEVKEKKAMEVEPNQKPKQFYFKDLQSYQSAYILPENNSKDVVNDLKPNSIFHQKMKTIQKMKQNQLQKATSFNPRLIKEEEALIKEKKQTVEKAEVEADTLITEKAETVPEEGLVEKEKPVETDKRETAPNEETFKASLNQNHHEKEVVVPETKSFLKQLWNKIKFFD